MAKYFIDTALPQHPESKRNVQQKLYQLQTHVEECTDSDALNAAAKHLQNAITAVKALQQAKQILPIERVYAANRNHEKQNRFFSTKKRKVSKSDWAKLTLEERIQCKSKLRGMDTKYCAVCLEEDDHCNEDVVD